MIKSKGDQLHPIYIVLYRVLDEDPVENYVLYVKFNIAAELDYFKTTLNDFYLWLYGFIDSNSENYYMPYMFRYFDVDFNESKTFNFSDNNKSINQLFDCGKPINIIFYPEFEGAGCWGESNGIRVEINYNENNHMSNPHIHASKGDKSNRISIIDFHILNDKYKRDKNLSKKNLNSVLKILKSNQIEFMELWNYYACCDKIIDIEHYKQKGTLKLINRPSEADFMKYECKKIQKHKWVVKNERLKMV